VENTRYATAIISERSLLVDQEAALRGLATVSLET
jgi:hypothetical protein